MKRFTLLLIAFVMVFMLVAPTASFIAETTEATPVESEAVEASEEEVQDDDSEGELAEEAPEEPFKVFMLDQFDEMPFKFEPYKGKVILMSMFTIWCPHCVREIPDFQRIQEEYSESVQVLMVHVPSDEKFEVAENYFKDNNINLQLESDANMILASVVGLTGFPTNVMFNTEGEVALYTYATNYDDIVQTLEGLGVKPDAAKAE